MIGGDEVVFYQLVRDTKLGKNRDFIRDFPLGIKNRVITVTIGQFESGQTLPILTNVLGSLPYSFPCLFINSTTNLVSFSYKMNCC